MSIANNVTTVLRLVSNLQLENMIAGGYDSMSGGLIEMVSSRLAVSSFDELSSVSLGSIDDSSTTAAFFNTSLADFLASIEATHAIAAKHLSTDGASIDVKLATVGENIYSHSFKGSAGTGRDDGSGVGIAVGASVVNASNFESVVLLPIA